MTTDDVVIVGGGPAGIQASRVLGMSPRHLQVALIRPEEHSMIYCAMPYVLEGIIPLEKTFKEDSLVTGSGAELIRDEVVEVDFVAHEVRTAGGRRLRYDQLLLATGAEPAVPPVPGKSLHGVMTFKTEGDLARIIHLVEKGLRKAVIVGAGAIGLELAQSLKARGVEVYLVDMEDYILPNLADAEMVEEAQGLLQGNGIHLYLGDRVIELRGEQDVEEVVLESGRRIGFGDGDGGLAGLVVFCTGMKAKVDLFRDTELALGGNGILVDETMATNIPGVYAVGDCVEYVSAITGKTVEGKLATNAIPMGKVAARNILGETAIYPGFYNAAATKVYDLRLGGTGLTERVALAHGFSPVASYGETSTRFPIIPGARKVKVKLVAERRSGLLLGGQVVGGEAVAERIDLLTYALQRNCTVRDLAALAYCAQPYQTFFPANNAIVMAAEQAVKGIGE